ncbi:putative quinol monooxygenase [Sandaracinobacteroides hominis]|uniref:putative quinol monooxygenase n=1 Tax=Sandaracinobacteroides hominis TaxID=2780086 RepID=UPI0018F44CF3|nr:putative quinol monooxygenase [Sandaracinobacteroides hominis]
MTQRDQLTAAEIRLIAIVQAKPGHEEAVADILKGAVELSRNEEGCLEYSLHRDREAAGRFVFIECWANADALAAHEQTAHFLHLGELLPQHIDGAVDILKLQSLY